MIQIRRRLVTRFVPLALLLAAAVSETGAAMVVALAPGDPAPLLVGTLLDNGQLKEVDFREHRATLVNFWATWCEPCHREMPSLDEVYKRLASDGLYLVGVVKENISVGELRDFIQAIGVEYPILVPRRNVTQDWGGIGSLPVSFLIDANGKVLRRYLGATPEQVEALLYDIEAAVAGRPLGPVVIPENPDIVTEKDRPKKTKRD